MISQTNVYLDTHVVVWLYQSGLEKLSKNAVIALENSSHKLLICPMVKFEIDLLHEIGRINVSSDQLLKELTQNLQLTLCQKSWMNTVNIAKYLTFTRDPFDRLITAHAMIDNSALITKDSKISDHYTNCIW
ncbi:MAG: PIN domain-containing protein [Moraxella sp.]|nr:PIN domain-containing protein [Moraxella sp.]